MGDGPPAYDEVVAEEKNGPRETARPFYAPPSGPPPGSSHTLASRTGNDFPLTPQVLRDHLELMSRTNKLMYDDDLTDTMFLLAAERRYFAFRQMLQGMSEEERASMIPPLDVAMVWEAHLLSPYRYLEDCFRVHQQTGWLPLPVAALHRAHREDSNDLNFSKTQWKAFHQETGMRYEPYFTKDDLKRFPFQLYCPWCSQNVHMRLEEWAVMYLDKKVQYLCPQCRSKISGDALSAKRFIDDLNRFIAGDAIMAGSLGSSGELDKVEIDRNETEFYRLIGLGRHTEAIRWNELMTDYITQSRQSRDRMESMMQYANRISRYLSGYQGIINTPYSIDLVRAVHRMRWYNLKTAKIFNDASDAELQKSIEEYQKFMALMKTNSGTMTPTILIDLSWHTHMLYPVEFREWCKRTLGKRINHDDTITSSHRDLALKSTAKLWEKEYGDRYTTDKVDSTLKRGLGKLMRKDKGKEDLSFAEEEMRRGSKAEASEHLPFGRLFYVQPGDYPGFMLTSTPRDVYGDNFPRGYGASPGYGYGGYGMLGPGMAGGLMGGVLLGGPFLGGLGGYGYGGYGGYGAGCGGMGGGCGGGGGMGGGCGGGG